MAHKSWEITDEFWSKVEPLIPKPKRDPNKTYQRKRGAGRKPMEMRKVFDLKSRFFGHNNIFFDFFEVNTQ